MRETSTTSLVTIPTLSTEQARQVARLLVESYHFELIQILENVGHSLARLAHRLLDYDITDRPIVVLAGRGKNGAAGLVAARYLLNWGAWVQIVLAHPDDAYVGEAAHALATLQAMGAPIAWAEEGWELPLADLVIDAIIGDGLHAAPQGKARDLIQLANSSRAPILSLDAPSGLDTTTGQLFTPHIRAQATLLWTLPQAALLTAQAACGDLYLADSGVPLQLYESLGLELPPLFAQDMLLPLVVTPAGVVVAL